MTAMWYVFGTPSQVQIRISSNAKKAYISEQSYRWYHVYILLIQLFNHNVQIHGFSNVKRNIV